MAPGRKATDMALSVFPPIWYNDKHDKLYILRPNGRIGKSNRKRSFMTDVHNEALDLEDFDTILSPDIEFSGFLSFEKSFLIRGKVSGEISGTDLLVVDIDAEVHANIRAKRVIILGSVKGNVIAGEKVELASSGRLTGNVTAPDIHMEAGHYFNGRSTMTERKYSE
jgi:cytoskeletal protein CcmA (bactofilin family)